MSITLKNKTTIVASQDTAGKLIQYKREDDTLSTVTGTFEAEMSGDIQLSAPESDYLLEKGKVTTIQFIYIESDVELSVKLNGSADAHKIKPPTGHKAKLMIWTDSMATSPSISNLSTSAVANVSYIIAGSLT